MNRSKMIAHPKPQVKLDIEDFERKISDFKDSENRNNVDLKPLRSAKNIHQLRRFNFDDNTIEIVNTQRKLKKLKQLQKEKEDLMHSLEILKESAVSAIAEKEDEIEKLRVRDCLTNDEKLEYYESELERSKRLRMELEDERQQINKEFCEERSRLIDDLEEKQYLIQALHEEIGKFRRELEAFEQNDHYKTKRIKILEEENHRLALEIQEKSSFFSGKQYSESANLDQTVRKGSISSISSHHHNYHYGSVVDSYDNLQGEMDKSFISQRFDELSKIHKQQLNDLRSLYEKRIQDLREIYQKQLQLPEENVSVQSHTYSRKSRHDKKRQHFDNNLYLNLKDMYSIEEQTQEFLQTSRTKMNDLKYEIKMQNLSECPSVEGRHLRTEEDGDLESQFTTKYFENPFVFMKKNKSRESIAVEEHQIKTTLRLKRENERFENIQTEVHEEAGAIEQQEQQVNHWKPHYIFGVGLLSGAALASLVGILIQRNK